jgi:trimeric autotransporter adhesin
MSTQTFFTRKNAPKFFLFLIANCLITISASAQWTVSGTNAFFNKTGNVGIKNGSSFTPTAKLEVSNSSTTQPAIKGYSNTYIGILGKADGAAGSGVIGYGNIGVSGYATTAGGWGVYGEGIGIGHGIVGKAENGYAGYFLGKTRTDSDHEVYGALKTSSRIFVGATGTEAGGYSHLHFKNGSATTGGIIRASIGNSDLGDAPLTYQGSIHNFYGVASFTGKSFFSDNMEVNGRIMSRRLTLSKHDGSNPNSSKVWNLDNVNNDLRIFQEPNANTAGTVYMVVKDNGNVGIGTNTGNPTEKLSVVGSVSTGSRLFVGLNGTEAGGYSHLHFKNGTATMGGIIRASIGNSDLGDAPIHYQSNSHNFSGPVNMWTSLATNSRIFPGMLGTENGFSLVHFKNGTAYAGGIIRASQGSSDNGDAPLNYEGSSHTFYGGKVNIGGVSTPGDYGLYVGKGIMTEKVKVALVNTANWADYVFADDYKLRPLVEVAQFVAANKHLPGVPSAEEVKESGIDVATMDAKLLEKIEELTLYLIEMKKENAVMSAKIEKLEQAKK